MRQPSPRQDPAEARSLQQDGSLVDGPPRTRPMPPVSVNTSLARGEEEFVVVELASRFVPDDRARIGGGGGMTVSLAGANEMLAMAYR